MFRQSRSGIDMRRFTLIAVLACTALAGCTDLYVARRETISPLAGDSIASNRVTQVVDPWSRASANNNIAYNGEKMQTASERYRTGRVIPPVNATTSSAGYTQPQAAAPAASGSQGSSGASSGTLVK